MSLEFQIREAVLFFQQGIQQTVCREIMEDSIVYCRKKFLQCKCIDQPLARKELSSEENIVQLLGDNPVFPETSRESDL